MNKKILVSVIMLSVFSFLEEGYSMQGYPGSLIRRPVIRRNFNKRSILRHPSRSFSTNNTPEEYKSGATSSRQVTSEQSKNHFTIDKDKMIKGIKMIPSKESFDFGFEKVSATQKTEKVTDVFQRIAPHYNLMLDATTLGMHRLWKYNFVKTIPLQKNGVYLDLASGTGDIANGIYKRLQDNNIAAYITASDINPAMLEEGRKRYPHLSWLCANAENLPLESNSVDVVTIAFGLRTVTHQEKALLEAHRVLRPGGKFSCLELSPDVSPLLLPFYNFFALHIIPKIGESIIKDKAAYQYLGQSGKTFLSRNELLALMKKVGFEQTTVDVYTAGVVAVHAGYKSQVIGNK